ncbi:MAG: protein kinase [Candidatus Aminicenantes bacterium]|nr:protein kinase [Candidatus Aminicenantes bacterium]
MRKTLCFVLTMGMLGPLALRADEPVVPLDRYIVDSWNVEDGLPQNTIFNIFQSRDGFLWLATGRGIARFDGHRFRTFDDLAVRPASDNTFFLWENNQGDLSIFSTMYTRLRPGRPAVVDSVPVGSPMGTFYDVFSLEDREGRLWFFTEKGLFFVRDGPPRPVPVSGSGPEKMVKMIEDPDGRLWLLSSRRGLWRFDEQGLSLYRPWPELHFLELFDAVPLGRLWILATDRGVASYDMTTGDLRPFGERPRPPAPAEGSRLFLDSQGRLWAASGQSLFYMPAGGGVWVDLTAQLNSPGSSCAEFVFCEDRSGNVWLGRREHLGLYCCPAGREAVIERCPLVDPDVYSLLADRGGNLWVGTRRGLFRLSDPRILTFPVGDTPGRCRTVRKIFQDHSGDIYAVFEDCGQGQNTLWSYRGGLFRQGFNGKPSALDGCTTLFQDREGRYWGQINTDEGFNAFVRFAETPDRMEILEAELGISVYFAIAQDLEGTVWVDSGRGLDAWIGGTVRKNMLPAGEPYRDLLAVSDGSLWIARSQGVLIHRRGDFQPAFPQSGLSRAVIVDMHEDSDRNIWLGATNGGGLFLCRGGEIFHFSGADGLTDENILSIQTDDDGFLWLSTMCGILRLDKQELFARAAGAIGRLHPRILGRDEGMENIEGNSSSQSSLKDRDGRLWFCTMGGPVMIDPARITGRQEPIPVFIEGLSADDRALSPLKPDIAAGVRRLQFRYTAVDFQNPGRVRFRVKLEGFDRQWLETEAGSDRSAVYTNLPPGSYRFRVQACSGDGVWTRRGVELPLTIPPLFHQTWWFRSLAVVSVLAAVFVLGRFAVKFVFLLSFWRRKRLVGHYVLGAEIGYGLTSVVYRAHSIFSKSPVAVKVLKRESLQKDIDVRRFRREGALLDMLGHPQIVRVIARGEHERTFYIVMEYLDGETISQKLRREGPFEAGRAARILRQLTGVLRNIHGRGVVHRDLKPANIMLVEKDGRPDSVKLLDFGVASAPFQPADTEYGYYSGTLAYMAPEQIKNIESPAGDIYSLGMIAYEMTAGVRPFHDCPPPRLMEAILEWSPPPVDGPAPWLPPSLAGVIMAMLKKDPRSRPDLEAIDAVLDTLIEAQPFQLL